MQKNAKKDEKKDEKKRDSLSGILINSAFKFAFTSGSALVALHYNSKLMAHNQELYRQELNLQRATQALARKLISLEHATQQIFDSNDNFDQDKKNSLCNAILQFEQEIINNSSANSFYIQHWLERTDKLLIKLDATNILPITSRPRP